MKTSEIKYNISRFLNFIFTIGLIVIIAFFLYFNYDESFLYRTYLQRSIPWMFCTIWIFSSIIIYAKQYIELNSTTRKRFFDILFVKSYSFKRFLVYISIWYTAILTALSLFVSIYLMEKNSSTLNDFISGSNIIILVVAFYISIYSLIFSIIVSKSQKEDINGFEGFLNNLADDLYDLHRKADKKGEKKIYEVIMVDFHPFIGSKSLGIQNSSFKRYFEELERIAQNKNIRLTIVCHSKTMIESSFNAEEVIHSGHLIENKTVNEAIDILENESKVNIWRSDLIGPYHFIIIDDIAYDYLVVPFHYLSNKNTIQGNKHIDQSKVTHIHKAYHDIISATIKPKEICLKNTPSEITMDNFYETDRSSKKNKIQDKFSNIKGIKLRFQFEEKEKKNENPIINGKKGNFPFYDLKDTDCTFYILDEHFKIEKVKSSCNKFEEVYITHNITDKIAKYGDLEFDYSRTTTFFDVDSIKNGTDFEADYKRMKFTFSHSNNISLLKEMIFKFDKYNIYLEDRTFPIKIADKVFYKIKIIKDNELIESEYSYKALVTLW